MKLPKHILKQAKGTACDHPKQPIVDDFVLGAEWLWDHLVKVKDPYVRIAELQNLLAAEINKNDHLVNGKHGI